MFTVVPRNLFVFLLFLTLMVLLLENDRVLDQNYLVIVILLLEQVYSDSQ